MVSLLLMLGILANMTCLTLKIEIGIVRQVQDPGNILLNLNYRDSAICKILSTLIVEIPCVSTANMTNPTVKGSDSITIMYLSDVAFMAIRTSG